MSTFSSSVGAMFTAASVMISGAAWPGTSMMKQWLIRRSVRSPLSCATTAPISSSVCRLPFIRASALPSRTSATALAAELWLCAEATTGSPAISMLFCRATSASRAGGATRIGAIRFSRCASTAPASDTASHGCTTAVVTGGSRRAIASTR